MKDSEWEEQKRNMSLARYTDRTIWSFVPLGSLIATAVIAYATWKYVDDAKIEPSGPIRVEVIEKQNNKVETDKEKETLAEKLDVATKELGSVKKEYADYKKDAESKIDSDKKTLYDKISALENKIEELNSALSSKNSAIAILEAEKKTNTLEYDKLKKEKSELEINLRSQAAIAKKYFSMLEEKNKEINAEKEITSTLKKENQALKGSTREDNVFKDGDIMGTKYSGQTKIVFPVIGSKIDAEANRRYKLGLGMYFEEAFALYVEDGNGGFYEIVEKHRRGEWVTRIVPKSKIEEMYKTIIRNSR